MFLWDYFASATFRIVYDEYTLKVLKPNEVAVITFHFYLYQYIKEDSPCNQMDDGFLLHKKDRLKTALFHINRRLSTTNVVAELQPLQILQPIQTRILTAHYLPQDSLINLLPTLAICHDDNTKSPRVDI